jgi:uncharacterized repeat protein (TIGR01451 family)
MPNSLPKTAALALLAGALLIPAVPASAAPVAAAPVAAKIATAAEPYSTFAVSVRAPKTAKAGGKIKYTIVGTNTGPHYADLNSWFVGGAFPKGVDVNKIRYSSNISKMQCALVTARAFYCWAPVTIKVDESVILVFDAKLKKSATGTQKATLGVVTYNVDQGMENMSKEELDRLGVPEFGFAKTVKTKVVR